MASPTARLDEILEKHTNTDTILGAAYIVKNKNGEHHILHLAPTL